MLEQITETEQTLLLHFEKAAVESGGIVNTKGMSNADFAAAEKWNKTEFVQFGEIPRMYLEKHTDCTHWIILSEKAWQTAQMVRKTKGGALNPVVVRVKQAHF